jgi:DNA-directed RNA polymerase subunit RPC12/RpoP
VRETKIIKLEVVDRCPSCNYHFLMEEYEDLITDEDELGLGYVLMECPKCNSEIRVDPKDGREVIFEEE